MTTTHLRPSDLAIAATTAVAAHVLLFLALVVMASRTIVATVQAPPPQDVYVEIRPEMFERSVVDPVEAPPQTEDEQFVRTLASQASREEARETPFIGENNTKASGDTLVDPNAPRLPSIAGIEEDDRKGIETFDSDFSDGEDPAPVPMARPLQPASPPAPAPATPGEPVPLPGDAREAQVAREPGIPPEELRQTEDTIPVPRPEGQDLKRMEEQLPKEEESEAEPLSENNPGGTTAPPVEAAPAPPEDPRFSGEVRKRRLRGSIGNNGPVAPEVRNTPLGRYQAELSRAVEREWQRNCIRYRNHITPGILTIRFLVDDRGRVSGIDFLDVVEAGEIQKGFTMNALKQASIPIMPRELKQDLDGEPLELIYNFYF